MPTNRRRREHAQLPEIDGKALYRLSDGLLGEFDRWAWLATEPNDELMWPIVAEFILAPWITRYPCTRPSAFWAYDPAASDARGELFFTGEPQARFLARRGLLNESEAQYLAEHLELLNLPFAFNYDRGNDNNDTE